MLQHRYLAAALAKPLTQRCRLLLRCGVEHLGGTRRPRCRWGQAFTVGCLCFEFLAFFRGRGVQMLRQDDKDSLTLTGGVDLIFALTAGSFLTSCFRFRGQNRLSSWVHLMSVTPLHAVVKGDLCSPSQLLYPTFCHTQLQPNASNSPEQRAFKEALIQLQSTNVGEFGRW